MSKLTRIQKIILIVFAVVLGLGIFLQAMTSTTKSNLGYDAFTMLKYTIIDRPIQSITGWFDDFSSLWSVKEDNDQLRYELSQNPSYKALYEEERRKNQEYEEALKLTKDADRYTLKWAHVVARDHSSWNNRITIDAGKRNGIKEDMAVCSVNGMIGKVDTVSEFTSVVKLLTSEDKSTSASIKINIDKDKSVDGVLQSYDVKRGMYVIYLYDNTNKIKKGMQIVTSGMGGGYPAGLLIGEVDTVQDLSNQSGQTIYAKPVDDFQEFTIVNVIVGEVDVQ